MQVDIQAAGLEQLVWSLGTARAARKPLSKDALPVRSLWLEPGTRPVDPRMDGLLEALRVIGIFGKEEQERADHLSSVWEPTAEQARLLGIEPLDLAVALCDEVLLSGDQTTAAQVREMAVALLRRLSSPPVGAVVAAGVRDVSYQRLLIRSLNEKIKLAGLYETMSESSADSCCLLAEEAGMAYRRYGGKHGQHVVSVSPEVRYVDALEVAFRSAQLSEPSSTAVDSDPRLDVGRLLGYPACCSRRYLSELLQAPGLTNAWLELERRLETPGPVAADMNPALDLWPLKAVPCSLGCKEARIVSQRLDELASATLPVSQWSRLQEAAPRPWIMSLEVDGAGVELLTEARPEGRFPYQVGLIASSLEDDADPVIRAVKRGTELEVLPRVLRVWKGAHLLADLSGRAYIWWAQGALQVEFLREILESRRAAEWAWEQWCEVGGVGTLGNWMSEFREFVKRVASHSALSGVVVGEPEYRSGSGQAEFEVKQGVEGIVLRAAPAGVGKSFFRAGPWAFSYPIERPLDTQARQTLARRFADVAILVARG